MSIVNQNVRRGRRFQLELLEFRELPSAFGHPAYQAAEVSVVEVAHRGSMKSSSNLITPPSPTTPAHGIVVVSPDGAPAPVSSPTPTPTHPLLHGRETITGSLAGQGSVTPINASKGTTSFYSSGTTTVLGTSWFYGFVPYFENKLHNVRFSRGVAALADSSGDRIVLVFSGYEPDAKGRDFTFPVAGPLRGGVGNYLGAQGSFAGTVDLNIATGSFSIQLTVKLAPLESSEL